MNNEVEELEVITIIKKIRYKGVVWIPEKNKQYNVKKNYFIKWLQKNKQVGDVFNLEDFYKDYPKHKKDVGCRRRIDKIISDLIKERKIDQWHMKNEFRVLK